MPATCPRPYSAERTGTNLKADMYPQILAGAVTAASQVAIRRWHTADLPVALQRLASACSQPSRPPAGYPS
jgi:hypothetical protein